ncbi:MAG: hemerythrin [Phenylobacterium zucineum]|nr:MAG: hemerythrin [Phenylobacterium zucineum]
MPTAAQPGAGKSDPGLTKDGRARMTVDDGVTLLMRDHRAVEDLFKAYEAAKDDHRRKAGIVAKITSELRVHMQIEEEIFYPASRPFVDEQDTVNEAEVEHASAKDLMAQLEAMSPSDEYYDAKVKVLQEMIDHHVEEEETEYFPETRRTEMDLKAVGEQMEARKQELSGQPRAH